MKLQIKKEKRKKPNTLMKWLLRLMLCGMLILIALLMIERHVALSARPYIADGYLDSMAGADCVLVLGAGVRGEENRPTQILRDRLDTGLGLYEAGAAPKLLMSGDHGRKDYDEVNTMKAYAIERGAPSSHVFMDHAGFSTYESMVRAKEVFMAKKVIIVTQGYHLPRAIYIARSIGLDAWGVPADRNVYARARYYELREMAARVKDFFYVAFRPAPTYLGEAIPVSGDGNATND